MEQGRCYDHFQSRLEKFLAFKADEGEFLLGNKKKNQTKRKTTIFSEENFALYFSEGVGTSFFFVLWFVSENGPGKMCDQYSRALLRAAVSEILRKEGFSHAQLSSLQTLTDAIEHFYSKV